MGHGPLLHPNRSYGPLNRGVLHQLLVPAQIFSGTVTDITSYCFCNSLILPLGLKSTFMFCYLFIVTQVYLEEKSSNHMICKKLQHDDHFSLVQEFPNYGPQSLFIHSEDAKPFCQWWKNNVFTKNSLILQNVTYPETITLRKTPGVKRNFWLHAMYATE